MLPGLKIGIDLGTKNTVIYVGGKGIVVHTATAMAYDKATERIVEIGNKALQMAEKSPELIKVVYPLREGVISNIGFAEKLLSYYVAKICKYRMFKPNVAVSCPCTVTTLEKKILIDAVANAEAGQICLVDESVAAIIGADADIMKPGGKLVCDIGAGSTDVAVLTMGKIAFSKSVNLAGDALDEAIQRYIRRERNILIGLQTAERIKKTIGCAFLPKEEIAMTCSGKEYISNMPVSFEVTSSEIYLAMREVIEKISECIRETLEMTLPELVADIYNSGMVLTGGSAYLYGMSEMLSDKLKIKVNVAKNPELCVARGLGKMVKNIPLMKENGYNFVLASRLTGQ